MKTKRRDHGPVHIPVVYVAPEVEDEVTRMPIEEVRRRWRQLLAKVRKARELDESKDHPPG